MQGLKIRANLRFFAPFQETFYPQEQFEKEMKPRDIGAKPTFLAICFKQWRLIDKLYKCRTQDLQ